MNGCKAAVAEKCTIRQSPAQTAVEKCTFRIRMSLRCVLVLAVLAAALTFGLVLRASPAVAAYPDFPGSTWEAADPASLGWSLAKLHTARDYAREIGSTAVMIVQDGRVIAAWGDTRRKVEIHSVRKSFMSALYGIAVARRQIALDRTLEQLGIDDKPPRLSSLEKRANVRDLLMARSGIYHEAAYETQTMQETRPRRGSYLPGKHWFYNNWDFNALGTILRNATGEDTFAAVSRHLAQPLHMEDFNETDGHYVYHPSSDHPAYTMRFSARDLARFGWLYLNQGRWQDRQVVPAAWVAESTRPYSDARPGVGYGYLWWSATEGKQFGANTGPGSFSARGSGGQYIIVSPARRMVIVHLNDLDDQEKLEHREFGNLLKLIVEAAPR
jgi:CubicO group peptidase (beta-lactamase class C family)